MRDGVRAVAGRETIAQGQFPAFMDGIRDRVEMPVRRRGRFWTILSLSSAALVVAISIFSMFVTPKPVKARSEVESATSDVEGATVNTQDSTDDSPTIVWVHEPKRDVL